MNDIKNNLFEKLRAKGKESDKRVEATAEHIKALNDNSKVMGLLAKLIISLKERTDGIALADKERNQKEQEKSLAIIKGLEKINIELKEQSKNKQKIDLSEVEKLLKQINLKEMPPIPEVDLSRIEEKLTTLNKKEINLADVTSSVKDVYDVLLKAWLPSENAIQVIVKNQVKPSGGGGVIPFQDSDRNPVKPLVGSDGYLITNTNNVLVDEKYDYVGVAYPDGTTEVYTFKTGGASGTTVATVTIVYVDATKEYVSTVTKT